MYKPGDLVRHRTKPEWGVGRVTGETSEGKVLIKFASRTGDVLLSADGAATHLRSVSAPVTPEPPPAFTKVPPGPLPTRRTPCTMCAQDIRDIVTSADGAWQSCVNCSGRNGRQHVFMPFPGSFDPNDVAPPEGETSPDPMHGWCNACRAGTRALGYRLCSAVLR